MKDIVEKVREANEVLRQINDIERRLASANNASYGQIEGKLNSKLEALGSRHITLLDALEEFEGVGYRWRQNSQGDSYMEVIR